MGRNRKLDIINSILFAFAILGTNLLDYLSIELGKPEKIFATVILLGLFFFIVGKKKYGNFHSLPEQSRKFSKFFEKWYKRDGKLIIFCTDLEWLNNEQNKEVVNVLREKNGNIDLYLRNQGEDRIARDLINNGANLYNVKESIRSSHRFSILYNNGVKSIIIRNKDSLSNNIVFIDTDIYRDPYLISLAEDMLEECYE